MRQPANMRHRAKFCDSRSNRCCDMAMFLFSKMAATVILDVEFFEILMVGTVSRVELRHCAKFSRNPSNRGRGLAIFRYFKMAAAAILDFQIWRF